MAIHNYICDSCNMLVPYGTSKGEHKCPGCGIDMRWDINITIHGNYKIPIHSDSLALPEHQRAEHEQMFPDIELDEECRPVFDNFRKHEKYLEQIGAVKHPQKSKKLGRKTIYDSSIEPTPSV